MARPLITRRREKKRRPATPTLSQLDYVPGRDTVTGHSERLAMFIKRTMELKRRGMYLHEIAEKIAEEFNLVSVPHITTVAKWNNQGMSAIEADTKGFRDLIRTEQFVILEKLLGKWMPIATAQALEVTLEDGSRLAAAGARRERLS